MYRRGTCLLLYVFSHHVMSIKFSCRQRKRRNSTVSRTGKSKKTPFWPSNESWKNIWKPLKNLWQSEGVSTRYPCKRQRKNCNHGNQNQNQIYHRRQLDVGGTLIQVIQRNEWGSHGTKTACRWYRTYVVNMTPLYMGLIINRIHIEMTYNRCSQDDPAVHRYDTHTTF